MAQTSPAVLGPVESSVRPLVERLRLHGRADDLNALVDDAKRLRHSEREAIEALQAVAIQAAAELERLQPRADLYQWLRGGPDVPQFSVRWPRWEVRNWDGRHWNTLFADGLDAALRRDMEGERPNAKIYEAMSAQAEQPKVKPKRTVTYVCPVCAASLEAAE